MRSTKNVRDADVRGRRTLAIGALVAVALLAGPADAQTRRRASGTPPRKAPAAEQPAASGSGSSLRMQDTAIEGERQTPDIFFILPTGKGGNLQAPHRRDYSADILEPVVKPWLEKDAAVGALATRTTPTASVDWEAALAEPAPPPSVAPAPQPVLSPSRSRPAAQIPTSALSRPPPAAPAAAPPPPPRAAAPPPAPPPPPPAYVLPPTASGATAEGVPILAPQD